VTQEIPERMPRHRIADSDLGLARQHLTAAINHSVDGRDRRTHRHLDAAIHAAYGELSDDDWRELAAAKVKHQRGERQAARRVVRATADVVDARLGSADDA
jgi:hypothetical protein